MSHTFCCRSDLRFCLIAKFGAANLCASKLDFLGCFAKQSCLVMPKKTRKKLSPAQQRDLDIEIGFIEGVVQRDPQYLEALQILGDDYTRRGKFENGLKIDEKLARLR